MASVKAAIIPPIPELPFYGNGTFHLLLSHLIDNRAYFKHYREQRARGAYLVLDNSAHEFEIGQKASTLLDQAMLLNAQEIVVPDCLDDAEGTIESALSSIEYWFEGDRASEMRDLDPALMYVPQGKDKNDWVECLRELVRLQVYTAKRRKARPDFVIGLSKDYETWDGGLLSLLGEYLIPMKIDAKKKGVNIQIHLLGWGRQLNTLGQIEETHSWIRSTDSAKPFVYALKNVDLAEYNLNVVIPKYPKRNKGYFQQRLSQQQHVIARSNVRVFKGLAGDQVV